MSKLTNTLRLLTKSKIYSEGSEYYFRRFEQTSIAQYYDFACNNLAKSIISLYKGIFEFLNLQFIELSDIRRLNILSSYRNVKEIVNESEIILSNIKTIENWLDGDTIYITDNEILTDIKYTLVYLYTSTLSLIGIEKFDIKEKGLSC